MIQSRLMIATCDICMVVPAMSQWQIENDSDLCMT